jgi:predicted house-cleaning noncanonical NTP pyrophosphatase (MazG superfamily)
MMIEGAYRPADSSEYADDVVYDKIVRDGIPEYLESVNVDAQTEISEDNEKVIQALLAKILEETTEYDEASLENKPGELADIAELLYAIAKREGFDWAEVEAIRLDKLAKRGAYDKGIFLKRATKRST